MGRGAIAEFECGSVYGLGIVLSKRLSGGLLVGYFSDVRSLETGDF